MDAQTQDNLKSRGYTVGDACALLDLTPEEEALIDTGLALSNLVRATRLSRGLTQKQLAERLGTKQPNIARLETAAGTSFDALFQALYAMQVAPREIAAALEGVALKTSPAPGEAALREEVSRELALV